MKKSILITGMSGSGKSTLGERLKGLGYCVYDIENIPKMFIVTDVRTGVILKEWDVNDLEQISNLRFACDKEKLRSLISEEVNETVFYCGTATNIEEIVPLFNKVILLQASPETIKYRLSTRATHDFARTPEMQDWILELKELFEKTLINRGAIVVEADGSISDTIKKVLTSLDI